MSILILDGRTTAALAVLQSLGRKGHRCFLAAAPGPARFPARASRYATFRAEYPDPLANKAAFQAWILRAQEAERFRLILPVTESTLMPLHELRENPALSHVLALPPPAAVEVAFDKEKARRLAESLDIPTPGTRFLETAADRAHLQETEWLFPVVVKSARSKAWKGDQAVHMEARLARNREQMESLIDGMLPLAPVQVQQRVPGSGVGVELLTRQGQVVMSFAHRRIHESPLTGGASTYRQAIDPPPALLEAASALMRALSWHGVAMVEFRVESATGRYWFLEINGRFWGSLPLAIQAGADFPNALVDLLLEGREPGPVRPRWGLYARNVAKDIQWTKALIRHRRGGADLLTRPLFRTLLEWTRVFTGRDTWDGASFRDPAPILHELWGCLVREVEAVSRVARKAWIRRRARTASLPRLRALAGASRILVLCQGNICRSPFAQARLQLGPAADGRTIRSGGFLSSEGRCTPADFQTLAAQRGLDLSAHRSRRVGQSDLDWAEVILIMDAENFDSLVRMDHRSVAKTVWLGALDPEGSVEIEDPYGLPPHRSGAILDRLDRCLAALGAELETPLRR